MRVAQFNVNHNNNTTYVGQRRILAKIRASPCHHHRSQLRASRASSVLLLRATAHNFRCTVATTPNLICASRSLMWITIIIQRLWVNDVYSQRYERLRVIAPKRVASMLRYALAANAVSWPSLGHFLRSLVLNSPQIIPAIDICKQNKRNRRDIVG